MKRLSLLLICIITLTASHPWQGKRIAYLGDSITDANLLPDETHYWAYLQEWLESESYVYGISGHQWTHLLGQANRLKNDHGDNFDAIMIFLGTNDYNTGIPLGEWFTESIEKTNANGIEVERRRRTPIFDKTTFKGRINYALDSLKRMFPTKQIVLMTPIHRGYANFSPTNIQPSEEFCNSCGEYLDAYIRALKEASGIWSVPVIDTHASSGLMPSREEHSIYVPGNNDFLHPNRNGHHRLALCLYYQLMALPCGFDGQTKVSQQPQKTDQPRHAVVDLSSIYMRIAPDYESALETQELMGTVVEITGEKGYWREVLSPQPYKAWCTEKGITEMSPEALKAYQDAPKCMFTQLYGHVYEQPSCKSRTVCDLVGGDIMRFAGQAGNDGKDSGNNRAGNNKKGWTKIILPDGTEGWVKSDCIKPHKGFRSIAKGEGDSDSISDNEMEDIIANAFRLKGVPYLWGGMTPKGVDCSGLVRWSYMISGILLPRNASQMIHCGDEVPLTLPQNGKAAGLENLRRGDLVFFGSPATDVKPQRVTHVGIYIGEGRIIHSSHLVRVNSLIPGEDDYYENAHRLIAARRL